MNNHQSEREKTYFAKIEKNAEYCDFLFELKEEENTAILCDKHRSSGNIVIPRFVKHSNQDFVVKSIKEGAFKVSFKVRSIQFPPDSEIQSIERNAFYFSLIESITIPASLTELREGWCAGTPKLKRVTVDPNNQRYKNCEENDKLIVGKSDIKSDKYDVLVFACRDIQTIEIPPYIRQIESHAFDSISIESFTIPASLTELKEGWCAGTPKLKRVIVDPSNQRYKNCEENEKLIVGKSDIKSDKYDVLVFACRDVKSANIPPEIIKISSYAFSRSSIVNVFISPHVKQICKYSFSWCNRLRRFEIPQDSELQKIEKYSFSCSSIECIFIPRNVTRIYDSCFFTCDNLKMIEIDEKSSVKIFGKKFKNLIFIMMPKKK
ncbi:hypothetical protein M9Y10_037303 [Tritrichomonas musculus]|uniref:Uncharacterized protein n=1 Tax=Tritrichomonas musculus TaxID=1915356 RepID=A0ABR2GT01_9EUKA